jgi:hypothetical protein
MPTAYLEQLAMLIPINMPPPMIRLVSHTGLSLGLPNTQIAELNYADNTKPACSNDVVRLYRAMTHWEISAAILVCGFIIFRLIESLNASAEDRNKRVLEELARIRALLQNYDGSSTLKNIETMVDRELERQSDIRHDKQRADLEA